MDSTSGIVKGAVTAGIIHEFFGDLPSPMKVPMKVLSHYMVKDPQPYQQYQPTSQIGSVKLYPDGVHRIQDAVRLIVKAGKTFAAGETVELKMVKFYQPTGRDSDFKTRVFRDDIYTTVGMDTDPASLINGK